MTVAILATTGIHPVSFRWNANTEPDIAGYKIYKGLSSGVYGAPVDMGNVTKGQILVDLRLTWYFALTAYNTGQQESGFSSELVRNATP